MIVENPRTEDLACTGSVLTYGKIVWGNQDKTDPALKPLIDKPFLAELGSVNLIIVVPGDWSARAVVALGQITEQGNDSIIASLVMRLQDEVVEIRQVAVDALEQVSSRKEQDIQKVVKLSTIWSHRTCK